MRPGRPLGAALALLALVAAAGCGERASPPPGPAAHPFVWIVGSRQLAALRVHNAGLVRRLFDNPHTFVVADGPGPVAMPQGYRSVPAVLYTSAAAFAADLARHRVDPRAQAAIYDPEDWPQTPPGERADPRAAARRFARLAHHEGLRAILAPGRDIVAATGARCGLRAGERLDHAYLRCRIPAGAADYEWLVVQAAPEELDHSSAAALLGAARRQAGGAGLIATFSITPLGRHVWPGKLAAAARNEAGSTAGLMLNFSLPHTQMAADVLRHLRTDP